MNKLEALKQTIVNVESGKYEYDWYNADSCNCGVVARTLCGDKSPSSCGYYQSPLIGGLGVFSRKAFCLTTNLPLPLVFQSLKDAGFTHEDTGELERLANEKIAYRLGWELIKIDDGGKIYPLYANKENLIAYLREWVKILEEQDAIVPTPVELPIEQNRTDIRKSLAVLPVSEVSDAVGINSII